MRRVNIIIPYILILKSIFIKRFLIDNIKAHLKFTGFID